jgi:copper chaperone
MEQKIFNVENMSCSHCVNAITKAVEALDGVIGVKISLEKKTVDVEYDISKLSCNTLKSAIEDCGYNIV